MDASSLITKKLKFSGEYIGLIVGQYGSREYFSRERQEESLHELMLLCDTAGIKNVYDIMTYVPRADAGCYFTSGIMENIREIVEVKKINIIIADVNLKPAQLKNLEEYFAVRVIGRIELILDIFAMRAKTREAALQVELAQLTYILPRLKGLGGVLSRLGGGIGTRGPGETMLEADRRHIRSRIQKIRMELDSVSRHRKNTRKNRTSVTFALVGYTNAGKSTLLNVLSSSSHKIFAEDRLFATLDASTRKVYLGEVAYKPFYAAVTDTVGFIRNLPLNLAAAFKSTLEEILYVDIIIIVADSSSMMVEDEIVVVENELEKLGVKKKQVLFFNKDDIIFKEDREHLMKKYPEAVWGNTLAKEGITALREAMFRLALEFSTLHLSGNE